MIAQTDADPASVISASCEAPAKTIGALSQPTHDGIADSVIANPITNPNGIAGMASGTTWLTACRSTMYWRDGSTRSTRSFTTRRYRASGFPADETFQLAGATCTSVSL